MPRAKHAHLLRRSWPFKVQLRHRGKQLLGIGMLRRAKDVIVSTLLDVPAIFHHDHPKHACVYCGQITGNKYKGQVSFGLQLD